MWRAATAATATAPAAIASAAGGDGGDVNGGSCGGGGGGGSGGGGGGGGGDGGSGGGEGGCGGGGGVGGGGCGGGFRSCSARAARRKLRLTSHLVSSGCASRWSPMAVPRPRLEGDRLLVETRLSLISCIISLYKVCSTGSCFTLCQSKRKRCSCQHQTNICISLSSSCTLCTGTRPSKLFEKCNSNTLQ